MNLKEENNNEILPGQISVFDVIALNKTSNNSKAELNKNNVQESPFTLSQLITYKRYMASANVLRVICFFCGDLGIELRNSNSIVTHIVEKEGREYSFVGRAGVFSWDKIIFISEEIKYTSIQEEKLKFILDKDTNKVIRVIKRKGDLNILIEEVNKVISILPNGWVLESKEISLCD